MYRSDKVVHVCDTKRMYDTEWEADRAALLVPFEAESYVCPGTQHYHIAHKNREERLGHGLAYRECSGCKQMIKRQNYAKHLKKCKGRNEK